MRCADYGRLILLAALWGASFLFMRIAAPAWGAMNTAFFRVLFGFTGLLAIVFFIKVKVNFSGKFGVSLLLGVINSGVPFLMYCLAAKLLPAGYSAILNATTPLMGVVLGSLFFHEALTVKKMSGVVLGLAGIALITATGAMISLHAALLGSLACLVATSCYAVAGFLTRRWIAERGGLEATLVATGSQLGALLFLLPFFVYSIFTGPPINWQRPDVWLCVLAVGVICTAFAYVLYFRLIADIGALRALTVTFLIPPFGILWGYFFLDERLSAGFVAGVAAIGIAVWLVVGEQNPAKNHDVPLRK